MTTLYSCKSTVDDKGAFAYRITKFDSDMNVESSYSCNTASCDCPASVRPSCRHRDMLPKFIARGAVNTMWMFDFDRSGWVSMDLEGELAASAEAEIIEPLISPDDINEALYGDEVNRALSTSSEPSPSPSPLLRRF